jgi:hypothetical protein
MKARSISLLILLLLLLANCSSGGGEEGALSMEDLMNPEKCMNCHPNHYREWSGSMHAYAADDPVFLAMNRRGQRETDGLLGDFCVQCHAPMAVKLGLTTDGLNLDELPQHVKGVTCYFCHTVKEVKGTHNNPLELADDGVMLGALENPVETKAHKTGYSALLDRKRIISGHVCGSCHDIVNDHGVHLERTFDEWKKTDFADPLAPEENQLSCSKCHMRESDGLAAESDGVALRKVHDHSMPGVDVALTPWPEKDAQIKAIERDLATVLLSQLCVELDENAEPRALVVLENVGAGHSFPSGAGQDRRAWVELVAYAGDEVIHQSGVLEKDEAVADSEDPDLWVMRDFIFNEEYEPVHMFWEAYWVLDDLLKGSADHHQPGDTDYVETREAQTYVLPQVPDRVTLRVFIRPMGMEVLWELVGSGDLDPKYVAEIPTFELKSAALEWTADEAVERITPLGTTALCMPKFVPEASTEPFSGADVYVLGLSKDGINGELSGTLKSSTPTPPTIGENSWTVLLTDSDESPIEDATITATTWMPDHNHGSAITAVSTHLGDGEYTIEPIELFMPGLWEITLHIEKEDELLDEIVFKFWIN